MVSTSDVVRIAEGEIGKSYASHRDCSGFTAWVYRQVGITIPEGSVAQWGVGDPVPDWAEEEAGDLLFWSPFEHLGHVGICDGKGGVIHAMNPERGIIRSDINANMGGPYEGARKVIEGEPDPDDGHDGEHDRLTHHERRRRRRKARREERKSS